MGRISFCMGKFFLPVSPSALKCSAQAISFSFHAFFLSRFVWAWSGVNHVHLIIGCLLLFCCFPFSSGSDDIQGQ